MESEDLLKGNRLLAAFDGIEIGISQYSWRPGCQEPIKEQHLNYHASWGWLIPIWSKVKKECFRGLIPTITNGDENARFHNAIDTGDVLEAFAQIVIIIERYSDRNKQSPHE